MKNIDLNKIGKQMPYKIPSEDFFENFTNEIMAKVEEKQPTKVFSLKRTLAPIIGLAASIAIIVTLSINLDDKTAGHTLSSANYNVEQIADSFFAELSDEELDYLASESAYSDDFYASLPTNI